MGSSPTPPDPNAAAIAGTQQTLSDYPYTYDVNALSQLGQTGQVINPQTGQPQTLDFTGLGTADVQNQYQNQMAQTLLSLQQQYGDQYVQQALQNLQQSDPQGYAAYNQMWQQIQTQNAAPAPNLPLATATQNAELTNLNNGQTLSPTEQQQVAQGVQGNQIANGIFMGDAPAQAVGNAEVGAMDAQQQASQQAAGQYLAQGVSPSDVQYQNLQQNMANLGAFINGQTPTAQFSQIGGAGQGAAPDLNTGYSTPTLNEGQMASQGLSQANQLFAAQQQETNPYIAGLSMAGQGVQAGAALGAFSNNPYQPAYSSVPNASQNAGALSEYNSGVSGYENPAIMGDFSSLIPNAA